jgi:predicted nuclease with TOPRIM domain
MASEKLTPTQKLKLAEAEISKLKDLIHKLQDEHVRELNTRLAETQNQNYTLGYDEGFSDATKTLALARADAGIARFFKK